MSDEDWKFWITEGDCVEVMGRMQPESISAVVCDPPYEIGFMNKDWDNAGVAFDVKTWEAALRVLKPGGHLLAFGGTRTYHRMTCAIEDAGFEIRDSIIWVYGSGFPKSMDVSKAIDKDAGHWRGRAGAALSENSSMENPNYERTDKGDPITAAAAAAWSGWGTALKPAHEPIVVARKPLVGTVAANVLAHGTGALNIDGCRIGTEGATKRSEQAPYPLNEDGSEDRSGSWARTGHGIEEVAAGRWPANIIFDEERAAELDEQSGTRKSGSRPSGEHVGMGYSGSREWPMPEIESSSGGASRFFYVAKPSKRERNKGLEDEEESVVSDGSSTVADNAYLRDATQRKNTHTTVKPVALMRYLVRLVTPPGGVVLDPFLGSGTTLMACVEEGVRGMGIEQSHEYAEIARKRVAACALDTGI